MAIYIDNVSTSCKISTITACKPTCMVAARDPTLNAGCAESSHWFLPFARPNKFTITTCSKDTNWYGGYQSFEWACLATPVSCTSSTGCVGDGYETLAQRYGKAVSGYPAITRHEFYSYLPSSCNLCGCFTNQCDNGGCCGPACESWSFYDYNGFQHNECPSSPMPVKTSIISIPNTRFTIQTCGTCFRFRATSPVCTRADNKYAVFGDDNNQGSGTMAGIHSVGKPETMQVTFNQSYGMYGQGCMGRKGVCLCTKPLVQFAYNFNNGNPFMTLCHGYYVKVTSNYCADTLVGALLYCINYDSDENEVYYSTCGCCYCSCAFNFGPSCINPSGVTSCMQELYTNGNDGRIANYTACDCCVNDYVGVNYSQTLDNGDCKYYLTYISPWITTNTNVGFDMAKDIIDTISRNGGMWWHLVSHATVEQATCTYASGSILWPSGDVSTTNATSICFSWNCDSSHCLCLAHPYKILESNISVL